MLISTVKSTNKIYNILNRQLATQFYIQRNTHICKYIHINVVIVAFTHTHTHTFKRDICTSLSIFYRFHFISKICTLSCKLFQCVCDFYRIFAHAEKYAMFINAANCASCWTDRQLRPAACGVGCCVSHNLLRPRLCVVFVASAYVCECVCVCVSVYVLV